MTLELCYKKLKFHNPSGTSRGILRTKDSWFVKLQDGHRIGIGEISVLEGLSPDLTDSFQDVLVSLQALTTLESINTKIVTLKADYPAIAFGLEMAMLDLQSKEQFVYYENTFNEGKKGIPINGLVWMGSKEFMYDQIKQKISDNYKCIKLKIAAIDFDEELSLLKYIRNQFTSEDIELRVDANGGFSNKDALENLKRLSDFHLHSIEQPIAVRQWEEMAELCELSPLDIALDEELIGISLPSGKSEMLNSIKPQYIILKPSLLGGFSAAQEWISLSVQNEIGWWVTSALESNIGLAALAQWTFGLDTSMYQGLGTGQLYSNNVASPLYISSGALYSGEAPWGKIDFNGI